MDVPDDIIETVKNLLSDAWDGDQYTFLSDRIETAILVERNRCKEIILSTEPVAGAIVHDQVRAIDGGEAV